MAKREPQYKYPGPLGKRGRLHGLWLARALAEDFDTGKVAEVEQEIAAHHMEMLDQLLLHFGIPQDDKNPWLRLAFNLATIHVPAFQSGEVKKRGRPKSTMLQRLLKASAVMYREQSKAKRGRPKKWTTERIERIQAMYARGAKSLREQGRRVTIVAAFREYARLWKKAGKLEGWRPSTINEIARYYADRYRKSHRNPSKKATKSRQK